MKAYLQRPDKVGIIAEIKRASPSRGMIHEHVDIEELSVGYMQAGASALSILSDKKFFQGSSKDVEIARKFNYCPILRKDFIISEYQIIEAKSIGADCILLIAAVLTKQECAQFAAFAKKLGMEVLLEVHNKEELLSHVNPHVDLVGVNNRNLHDFKTDIRTSILLAEHIPSDFVKVSESGLSDAASILKLKSLGYEGFLIGGYFMTHAHPEEACARLVKEIKLG
jgi:indole-3-glycerol phosphate synthase